jgi:copper transport protein
MTGRGARVVAPFLVGFALALIAFVSQQSDSHAHATLGSTDPPANEIVSTSPGRVELRFTEPVEETYTTVILVDQTGTEVADTSFAIDSTDATIVRMVIPDDLARGTYSVVWRTLSAADGHRFSGYFAFTIGSTADVRTVIPPTFDVDSGVPGWLNQGVRWFVFLTLAALSGLGFTGRVVIRPALSPVWQAAPGIVPSVRRWALVVGLLYMIGSVFSLVAQIWGQTDDGAAQAIVNTLTDTRWGNFWSLRILIGALLTLGLTVAPWWYPARRRVHSTVLLALSAGLILPHALVSHASASRFGRTEAIAADFYHLLAMSIWFGGLLLILPVICFANNLLPGGQRAFLARLIPRFSPIALVCWLALGLTGFYSGYLQVGSWDGLRETEYGRALLFKLGVLAVVLLIAAANLVIVSRKVSGANDSDGSIWWRRFGILVTAEVIGVALALVFVGRMTAIEPARSVLAERENQQEISFDLNGRDSSLSLAPGSAGPNHFRLDIGGDALDPKVTATILLQPPLDMAGDKLVVLERTTGNAFEAHSAEMSVTGDWTMTVTVAQIGAFQWSTEITHIAPERKPGSGSISYPSWTFNRTALGGFVALLAGVIGLFVGMRGSSRSARREGFGLGGVALLAGVLLIAQGRSDASAGGIPLDTPNPVPLTDQAIIVGQSAFQANCIACHGVGGAGDGPSASGMSPPPANLLMGHAIYHADAEFFNWIRNGKPGTAMPAFTESLTEEQIWSTIHYIRSLQQDFAESVATPVVPGATPIP